MNPKFQKILFVAFIVFSLFFVGLFNNSLNRFSVEGYYQSEYSSYNAYRSSGLSVQWCSENAYYSSINDYSLSLNGPVYNLSSAPIG